MNIQRIIQKQIELKLFQSRAIIIYGPRQSGKTTLARKILEKFPERGIFLNCELLSDRSCLVVGVPDLLKERIGGAQIVVLDEAQTIIDIGMILKNFVDTYPEIQIIATGSSSFDLANRISEPMTGRFYEFVLWPLSFAEIMSSGIEYSLDDMMLYGMYPSVVTADIVDKKDRLNNIAVNYLYKDIFSLEQIKKPIIFENLVKYLALNTGTMISTGEIASILGTNRATVERYVGLMEQAFIIKKLYSFSRNKSNELKKSYKVYFLDIGLRNAIVGNNQTSVSESEKGLLFENFFIIERIKFLKNQGIYSSQYFWRTYEKQEIDLIEEYDNILHLYECKYSKANFTKSLYDFAKEYTNAKPHLVNKENIQQFLI